MPAISQEEFEDVELHQRHGDQHAVRNAAIQLGLLVGVAQDEDRPRHHAHAAVGPGLQVEVLPDARIQLHPCIHAAHQDTLAHS